LFGTIDSGTPIWQSIPRTLFLGAGEFDYDFSNEDFSLFAGGTYNFALTPQYINNQTFRIVITPGVFSKKIDKNKYLAAVNALNLNEKQVDTIKV
jgi:hypothetical protein